MIDSICTPCRASKASDVKTRLDLLRKVEGRFPTGFEVVGSISDFTNPATRKAIIDNLAMARDSGLDRMTIHSPTEREDYSSGLTNLSEAKSLEILKGVFDLANQVGAKVVTVHCELFHSAARMRSLTDKNRELLKESIAENLRKLDKGSVTLGIENMPYPLMGDVFFCLDEMIFDPLFTNPVELYEFARENSVEITFDTCHWATLCLPIPLVDIFQKIEDHVCLLHLSDAYGKWLEGTSVFKEGLIPGEGNLGTYDFCQLLSYLRKSQKSVILNMEVKDKDFRNPEESQETLTRMLSWLNNN